MWAANEQTLLISSLKWSCFYGSKKAILRKHFIQNRFKSGKAAEKLSIYAEPEVDRWISVNAKEA